MLFYSFVFDCLVSHFNHIYVNNLSLIMVRKEVKKKKTNIDYREKCEISGYQTVYYIWKCLRCINKLKKKMLQTLFLLLLITKELFQLWPKH